MSESKYWQRHTVARRRFLQGSVALGAGTTAWALAACSSSNNNNAGTASKPAATGNAPAAAGTARPAGAGGAAAPAASATGNAAGGPAPKKGGTLKVGFASADVFDPAITINASSYEIGSAMVYSRIIRYDGDGKILPDLANAPEQPDNQTYVFKVRPGIKWQNLPPVNGRAFTAEDAVFGLKRFTDTNPEFVFGSKLSTVDKFETIDPMTFRLTTKQPSAPFITQVADDALMIVSKEAAAAGNLKQYDSLVGTGPFMKGAFTNMVSGFLTRNPDYFEQGTPYVDRIEYTAFADANARNAALVAGQIDTLELFVTGLKQIDVDALKAQLGDKLDSRDKKLQSTYDTVINLNKKPLDDVRVRQAINLAVDRQACLNAWGKGAGLLMGGPVPQFYTQYGLQPNEISQLPGFRSPKDADLAEAKKLMQAAGVTSLSLTNCPKQTTIGDHAIPIQQNLKAIGVDIQVQEGDIGTILSSRVKGNFDIHFASSPAGTDVDPWVYDRYYTKASNNFGGYSNPQVDSLLDKQRQTLDAAARALIVKQVNKMILDDSPWIFTATIIFHPSFRNYVMGVPQNLVRGLNTSHPTSDLWLNK